MTPSVNVLGSDNPTTVESPSPAMVAGFELFALLASLELVLWTFSKHVLPQPWRMLPIAVLAIVWLALAIRQRITFSDLGFAPASWTAGLGWLLLFTLISSLAIVIWGGLAGTIGQFEEFHRWLQNAITQEVLQQILLQVFVFPRCAILLGRADLKASVAAGVLFALVHLPNWPLVALTLPAGIVWCEWFRRYRNMPAIWLSHLIVAAVTLYCLTPLLGRLRVGVGYLYVR